MKHLASDSINMIALSLVQDVYGSNGGLDDQQIRERLIETIRSETDYRYDDNYPAYTVAGLLMSMWEYMDRKYMQQLSLATTDAQNGGAPSPL